MNKDEDILNLTVKSSHKVNIKLPEEGNIPGIVGCAFMPGGLLLLCDHMSNKLKLLNSGMKMTETLQFFPLELSSCR